MKNLNDVSETTPPTLESVSTYLLEPSDPNGGVKLFGTSFS